MTSSLDEHPAHILTLFESFYQEQRRPLIALAYALSGSWSTAEDLAQETLTAAHESWSEISLKDNPGTWVRRMLVNKASSSYRRAKAEVRAMARYPIGRNRVEFPEVTGEIESIWAEVRRLPKRQAQIVTLIYVADLRQHEVAQVLEISKESVNTHLRRARQTLARSLKLEDEL